jgi:hypothetical protein
LTPISPSAGFLFHADHHIREQVVAARRPLVPLALAAAGPATPASAVDVKVYSGLGCRAAELPPAPQPTFNPNGTAFNQNRGEHLRLLCPVVKDADRILAVRVRVVAVRPNRIGCTLRTLRDDGSAQQTASSSHDPLPGLAPTGVRDIFLAAQSAPSTGVGFYALECTLPPPSGADAAGIILYRVVED